MVSLSKHGDDRRSTQGMVGSSSVSLRSPRRRWTKLTCRGFWARWGRRRYHRSSYGRCHQDRGPAYRSGVPARLFVTVLIMLAGIVVIASLIIKKHKMPLLYQHVAWRGVEKRAARFSRRWRLSGGVGRRSAVSRGLARAHPLEQPRREVARGTPGSHLGHSW